MSTPALTSRLDAVNVILTSCGESPVSSLSGSTADAANADVILGETLLSVQSKGWHFNTESDVPLTPDGDGFIALPSNCLRIDADPVEYSSIDIVQRGLRLYDRTARSYVFTAPIKAEIVYALPFEELPEAARRYISIRASRIFHDRFVGSETEHAFSEKDELEARASLNESNLDTASTNLFTANPRFASKFLRRR